MKVQRLISKLTKMNISHIIVLDGNSYNKDIVFSINGLVFKAGFRDGGLIIDDYCREICFDESTQEMQRRFFANFNQILKYSKL